MKTKIFGLLMLTVITLFGCKEKEKETEMVMEETEAPDSADFDEKVAVIRAFFQAHSDEDIEAQSALLADDMKWSPPAYNGNQWLGKGELVEALKGYHDGFDNIKYTEGIVMPDSTANGYWSGSVFPAANANASASVIRVYGTWTATHTESGKEIGVKFFNLTSVNDDGKIVQSSDYFDVHGLAAQLEEEE
ncbi:nuclear transport factor 2 family protein [uncultured Eudoraea sp.]|uniref:nuclear transport factor 2 family protein n=1 Tax=uncultured Eudoraea sp. TaxID=1035614 RepID=UPI0026302A6B|nr:nuclear transport factor 2 family protein [uncultured Eudoraea sp.]